MMLVSDAYEGQARAPIGAGAFVHFVVREPEERYGAPAKPRLLDQVRAETRTRHYSSRTEEAYVGWIRRFILFQDTRHPAEMGAAEVESFLSSLATDRRAAASTQNQALAALLFLYRYVLGVDLPWLDGLVRATRPAHLPVVLSRDEVHAVLRRLRGTPRLVALLLYGAGLRLLECCCLRVKNIDFGANQIVVRSGKGDRDRVALLPGGVHNELKLQLHRAHRQHENDLRQGAGWVALPHALARKYPNAGREWAWQWVFPATRMYVDRETRQRRRHHLHESVIQRSVRSAVRTAGITKAVNSRQRNFTRAKIQRALRRIEEHIEQYLAALDTNDAVAAQQERGLNAQELQEKIERLRQPPAALSGPGAGGSQEWSAADVPHRSGQSLDGARP